MVEIDINPYLFSLDIVGTLAVSWHGFFSFLAVAIAVTLVSRWAPLHQIDTDVVLSVAVWAIIGGIIGARVVHIIDNWTFLYSENPIRIIYIWTGGVAIWGGILGGLVGGVGYSAIMNYWYANIASKPNRVPKIPIGAIADLTAPALLFVQAIGRLGDIVNGEHCAKATDLFFGFQWQHPQSGATFCPNGWNSPVHPAIAFEMLWNAFALLVIWGLRGRLKPDGMLFALYLTLYSIGRFGITFLREDRIWALGLQQSQYISILVIGVAVLILVIKGRFVERIEKEPLVIEKGTRADRRRRA